MGDAPPLNLPYAVCEALVAACAVVGNALVIAVFRRDRRLRRRTNYYIVSLAVADLLVGLIGIPAAVLASVGLPRDLHLCLFTVSLLVVLCTISIFCLVAVSVDRYWAILHPMGYSRNVRTKTAIGIIGLCWASGTLVGFLPLLGWHADKPHDSQCLFTQVMDYNYLVFLYFATIIFPALLLAAFYAHIYRVVLKQLRQIVTMNPDDGPCFSRHVGGAGTMLRVLGAARKREVKATQNLSIIVLFFIICWVPLYTINFIQALCRSCHVDETVTNMGIILSHLNSAGNPLLYAYHLRDFRAALKHFLCGLLGHEAAEEGVPGARPGLGSQSALPQRMSRHGSTQSLSTILSRQRHSLAGDKFRHACSDSSITPPATLNGVCKAATLPLAGGVMWTLAEVSSGLEEADGVRRRTVSADGDSGAINCAYVGDVARCMDGSGSVTGDDVFEGPPPTTAKPQLSVGDDGDQACSTSGVKLSPLKLVGEFLSGMTGESSSTGSNTSLICEGEQLAVGKHPSNTH
ncbi:adenosine receptor A2b [Bacillus rossius redtenbacheri]|uniref:adenosine receptor A2b n=1 Tax=Bacillus rossius redtenbacheri TaxID=93214 RepID=UPI002FDD6C93